MLGLSLSSISLSISRLSSVIDVLVGLFIPQGSDALITADGKIFLVAES